MEVSEKPKKALHAIASSRFPKAHIIAVSSLCLGLILVTALPSDNASAKRKLQRIDIPPPSTVTADIQTLQTQPISDPHYEAPQYTTKTVTVTPGDNLSVLFRRAGLGDKHMMNLLNANSDTKRLTSLYPGHVLEFSVDNDGNLARLNYITDQLNSFSFNRVDDGFKLEEVKRQPDIQIAQSSAFITQSLYTAGIDARLDDRLIMELADIFGWDIDFALDIRKGDHFKVVYEEQFLDGEKIGNGSIIAAEFVNQSESFKAVRYVNSRGDEGYYTPKGESLRKEFLRAPLDFRRISSNFNPRRLHPILKTKRPHRGIDYAAARGTPVWSSGKGRVIASGYSKANGNYVVIQHGNNVQTKYLHLHKKFVKKGDKVKQKQAIGTVGSTGLATGPHLHYEFLISGVHRNPRTIVNKLPKAKAVSHLELSRFVKNTRDMVAMLNEDLSPSRMASVAGTAASDNL